MREDDERRKGLRKYYKKIVICEVCHKEYGLNQKEEAYAKTCPLCVVPIQKKKFAQRFVENV